MTPIEQAAALCRRWEGFRANPYLCPAGVATVGFGTTRYEDGSAVQLTDPPVSVIRAEELLLHDLTRCMVAVAALCPDAKGPQAAALADFVFNLGAGRLRASTLRRRINAGDPGAALEFGKWVYGGGRRLPGLIARRADEASLFVAG